MTKQKKMLTAVLGIAVNNRKQFLLTQRNQPKDPAAHLKWQFPGGGMEIGETPEQTLAREIQEEIGVACRILFPYPITKTHVWEYDDLTAHITILCYVISIDDQAPSVQQDPETNAWKWFTPSEIAALENLPQTMEYIEEVEKIIKTYL